MEVFTEQDVLKSLVTIRQSALPADAKAVFRDLFLDYAGTSDERRKNVIADMLIERLREYPDVFGGIQNTPDTNTTSDTHTTPVTVTTLGHQRPSPRFASTSVLVREPSSLESEPTSVKTPTIDAKSRINQIKHEVNTAVGNPVNIISKNEQIGREYMTALLDAMKKNSAELSDFTSMTRLENAYQAVLTIIDKKPQSETEQTPQPQPEAGQPLAETPDVEPVEIPEPEIPKPIKESVPLPTEETRGLYHRPIDETISAEQPTPLAQKRSSLSLLADGLWKKKSETPDTVSEPKSVSPQAQVVTPSIRKVNVASNDAEPRVETPVPQKPIEPLHPLAEETALPEKIKKLKNEEAIRIETAKKPITDLKSPEIETGLEQLLSEWSLFRSSGMFGTGPSGINHPLYKQLAKLPMASVIAGRFEGATPIVKQQLTDYMNGWRYEQGTVHEMGETFETYLRRVIRQILERQRSVK